MSFKTSLLTMLTLLLALTSLNSYASKSTSPVNLHKVEVIAFAKHKDTILEASQVSGIKPEIITAVLSKESGIGRLKANPKSKARGAMQFMPRTWNHELKTHHKKLGLKSNVSIMNDRANILVGAMGMATDKAYLERTTGKRLTDGDVYMSRFVGRYGAKAILKGNPNAPISRYIKVDNRNGSLYTVNGRIATVKEFRSKMQGLITKEANRYQDVVNQARFDAFVNNIATTGMVDLNLAKL